MIAWTIEAAKNSGIFDRIILSTDDQEIADVAKKYGAEVPFMRPVELAQDATPHMPVLKHAVETLKEKENYQADFVAILQPTTPFREPKHFKEAQELLEKTGADSVISVAEIPGHSNPMWALKVDEAGIAKLFVSGEPPHTRIPRRQELPKAYTNSGHLYIFKTELLFRENPNFYGDKTAAYPIEEKYCINIDTLIDWDKAQEKIKETKI